MDGVNLPARDNAYVFITGPDYARPFIDSDLT